MGLRNCPCDCSATVEATQNSATLIATICPACDAQGSNVTFTGSGFTFQSTIVKPSSCVTIGGSTSFSVAGEGILTIGGEEVPAVFTLELIDPTPQVGTDNDVATIRIRTAIGSASPILIQFDFSPEEAQLTISECPGE